MAPITKPSGRVADDSIEGTAVNAADLCRSGPTSPEMLSELLGFNAELQKSRQFYISLLKDMPHPMVVTDLDDLIILFNSAATDLFGWREDDIAGSPLGRILARDNPSEVLADLKRERESDREWCGELRGRTISGDDPLLHVVVSPVVNEDGKTLAFSYLAMDVTEKHRLLNLTLQMDRMTLRSEMAATIVHTINNFLAVLSGSVELIPVMLESGSTDKVKRRLEVIRSTLVKIGTYCEGLRNTDSEEVDRSSQDLNALVECLVEFLQPQDLYSNVRIQMTLGERLPPVHIGVIQIQQVIASLIKNAAEAIAQKSIQDGRIEVSTCLAADGNGILVRVSDNGEGISDELLNTLSHHRYSSRQGGRGLGLVVARQILEDHGGRLELESELGKGSTITLYLAGSKNPQDPETEEVIDDSSCTA